MTPPPLLYPPINSKGYYTPPINTGGLCVPSTASIVPPVVYNKWFDDGNTDINGLFGANCDELYMMGEPASGDVTGKISETVLSVFLGANARYQQVWNGLAGDPLGASFNDNGTSYFYNTTSHDITTEAMAMLIGIRRVQTSEYRNLILRMRSSEQGYRFAEAAGAVPTWRLYGSSNNVTANATTPPPLNTPQYVLCWRDDSLSNKMGMYMSWEDEQVQTTESGNLTNAAANFVVGYKASLWNASTTVIPFIVFWSGSAAQTVIASRATTLPTWWSL